MAKTFREGFSFDGKDWDWWLDIRSVLKQHGINDAEELSSRLFGKQAPTVPFTMPPKPPKPTVGRIVHYITKDGNELPAIIVAISSFTPEQWLYLKAFVWGDKGDDTSEFAIYSEEKKIRTWHWPEREE